MLNISAIQDAMESAIVARKCFIVDIKVSADNDVVLTIESEEGIVTLDDCVEISRSFEEKFDREKEDYSITVTSAGLDKPFLVLKQYQKAVGTKVEAAMKGGRKFIATLVAADEESVTLKYSAKEAVPGKKKKETVLHEDKMAMESINYIRPYIEIN